MADSIHSTQRWDRFVECLVLMSALGIALHCARPYAGGWNDGSRLATVEMLVDRHTWSIDRSIFVQVPPADDPAASLVYDPAEPGLGEHGTLDKLFIEGHYYSDKSPVPALFLAGCYQLWQWMTGWTARGHPDRFCQMMTLASSGLAYVLAVWCIYRLGRPLRLPLLARLALTASFAFATVALPYARHVNNHSLLLGVSAGLALGVAWLIEETRTGQPSGWRLAVLGTLAGLGYTIDLGAGPVLLLCTSVLVVGCCLFLAKGESKATVSRAPWRLGILSPCVLFGLAVLPWLFLHHALNYTIGGTLKPANANPEFFRWPGSPFDAQNLTGSWIHDNPLAFVLYAVSMLVGKRGFLGHNLPLFLAPPALFILLRRRGEHWREALWAAACCGGTWLLYAATSNNSSGRCCSIRWFVPLLAPAYYVLALSIKRYPRHQTDFLVLSAWGAILVLLMDEGPWMQHMVPFFWPIQACALCSWVLCRRRRRQSVEQPQPGISVAWGCVTASRRGFPWRSRWVTTSSFDAVSAAPSPAIPATPPNLPHPGAAR